MVQSIDDARRRQSPGVGRVPPHNLEAEESLVGAMLLSRDAIVAALEAQVAPDDFYKPAHGHVFEAITSLYSQGEPADPVTVAEELKRAGVLDAVGGPAMPYILATLQPGAAVASCGNAGGPGFAATVLPFILRGVAVLGMNSVQVPIEARRALWSRLATDLRPRGLGEDVEEVTLDTLEPALDAIVEGRARGRWLVRVRG